MSARKRRTRGSKEPPSLLTEPAVRSGDDMGDILGHARDAPRGAPSVVRPFACSGRWVRRTPSSQSRSASQWMVATTFRGEKWIRQQDPEQCPIGERNALGRQSREEDWAFRVLRGYRDRDTFSSGLRHKRIAHLRIEERRHVERFGAVLAHKPVCVRESRDEIGVALSEGVVSPHKGSPPTPHPCKNNRSTD
jgi:hypothetical protein